jgi:hypothetical protein
MKLDLLTNATVIDDVIGSLESKHEGEIKDSGTVRNALIKQASSITKESNEHTGLAKMTTNNIF